MVKTLVFTGLQQVEVEDKALPELAANQAQMRTVCTLMSTGTENIVFNRLFAPGTHWDNWVKYPFYPGYAAAGVIEKVGPEVKNLKVGDLVVSRKGHAAAHVGGEGDFFRVPAGVDARAAVWFALAKIAFMGIKVSGSLLGQRVAVIGAGPIGQMALRWAVAAGARSVISVDPVAGRLELARQGGAGATIAKPIDTALDEIRAVAGGEPEVVIDSTGNAQVFQQALGAAARYGRVIVLGDTGAPAEQHLSSAVITRGLSVIGAHDCHVTAEWSNERIIDLFFSLVQCGRFSVANLNTHVFKPDQAKEAYTCANTRRGETMGIVFDWEGK